MLGRIARHLAGGAAAWLVFVAQGAAVYVGLLGYAVAADKDAGGPLAGPLLVLLAGGLGVVLVPLLFVPAGVAGEVAARNGRLLVTLSVAFAVAALLAVLYVAIAAVVTDVPLVETMWGCLGGAVAVLAPTGAYVGVAHGVLRIRRMRRPWGTPPVTEAPAGR